MVKPKKYLGQHFLTDNNIAQKIVDCLKPEYSTVCEIGPGTGVLTTPLLEKTYIKELKLIEIDTESVEYMTENFSDERLSIIEADFLRMNIDNLFTSPFALIGNFPYNISSQILFKVYDNKDKVTELVGMFQKEVADRVVSLDVMTIISISIIVYIGSLAGRIIYLDVAMVYALISFLGVVAVARYLERGL